MYSIAPKYHQNFTLLKFLGSRDSLNPVIPPSLALLPLLTKVTAVHFSSHPDFADEYMNSYGSESLLGGLSSKIKEVSFNYTLYSTDIPLVERIIRTLPNVTSLSLSASIHAEIFYSDIWSSLPNLQILSLESWDTPNTISPVINPSPLTILELTSIRGLENFISSFHETLVELKLNLVDEVTPTNLSEILPINLPHLTTLRITATSAFLNLILTALSASPIQNIIITLDDQHTAAARIIPVFNSHPFKSTLANITYEFPNTYTGGNTQLRFNGVESQSASLTTTLLALSALRSLYMDSNPDQTVGSACLITKASELVVSDIESLISFIHRQTVQAKAQGRLDKLKDIADSLVDVTELRLRLERD